MTFDERLKAIRANMAARNLDFIVAVHDGAHFIETPNPVTVISGFKSLGPAVCLLDRAGENRLIVTPPWDGARALADCREEIVASSDDLMRTVRNLLPKSERVTIGTAGLAATRSDIAAQIVELVPNAVVADEVVFDAAATKTDDEIAWAREATRIAELN